MRTNIDIDDALMAEAQRLSGSDSKRATVHEALQFFVKLKRQEEFRQAFGKYDWQGDLDAMRQGRGTE